MTIKRNFIFVLTAVLAIVAIGIAAPAAPPPGPDSKESGLIGTWSGWADAPWSYGLNADWLAVCTPGSNGAKNGEMVMNWVYLNPYLRNWYNNYPAVVNLTPGHGVWEQTGKNQYKYVWYAYGVDSSGNVVNSFRVTGTATNTDADNFSLTYLYEVFNGVVAPQDMSTQTPAHSTAGNGGLTRIPLVTP
jgi:hypothetical protein